MTEASWLAAALLLSGAPTVEPPASPAPAPVRAAAVALQEAPDTTLSMEEILEGGLDEVAAAFAWAWSEADVERIQAHLAPAPQRIRIQLGPTRHSGLTQRQATAALGDVLATRQESRCELEQVASAGGNPERGFAEVVWSSVPRGTSQRVTYTVFVGFLRIEGQWRVSEIRVLR